MGLDKINISKEMSKDQKHQREVEEQVCLAELTTFEWKEGI